MADDQRHQLASGDADHIGVKAAGQVGGDAEQGRMVGVQFKMDHQGLVHARLLALGDGGIDDGDDAIRYRPMQN
jgi:hypothetical protein